MEPLLTAAVTALAAAAGAQLARRRSLALPWLTLAAAALIVVGFAAQTRWPGLLPALQRDPAAVADGSVWRLATALLLQDGGAPGFIWNLVSLLLVGGLAEMVLAPPRWLGAAAAGAVAGGLAGVVWTLPGAGNSIAVMGLGGALLGTTLGRGGTGRRGLGAAGLALGLVLFLRRDIHGAALLAGVALGFAPAGDRPER